MQATTGAPQLPPRQGLGAACVTPREELHTDHGMEFWVATNLVSTTTLEPF